MISYGEGYKPLYHFKKNLNKSDNRPVSGGLIPINEEYVKQASKNTKKLSVEELEEFLKD